MYSNSDFIFDDFAVTWHNSNKFDSALVRTEKNLSYPELKRLVEKYKQRHERIRT